MYDEYALFFPTPGGYDDAVSQWDGDGAITPCVQADDGRYAAVYKAEHGTPLPECFSGFVGSPLPEMPIGFLEVPHE